MNYQDRESGKRTQTWTTGAFAGYFIGFLTCKILCAFSERVGPWG